MANIKKITLPDGQTYKLKLPNVTIPFGRVDSTSTATVMTATVDGVDELVDGTCIFLQNGVITSASGWTLNINGLGAKPVYQTNAAASRITTTFNVAYTYLFVYNEQRVSGGCWDMFFGYNSDSTAYTVRTGYAAFKPRNILYRYQLLLQYDETTVLPINTVSNSTATTKTLTTEDFDPFGMIRYYMSTGTVQTTANISASYLYQQYPVDLRYSFNCGQTLTAHKSLYLVAVPQTNGRAKLHDKPLSQELPQSEDGLIYIYLGQTFSTYQVALDMVHPIYCYKNGSIQKWTGSKLKATHDGQGNVTLTI